MKAYQDMMSSKKIHKKVGLYYLFHSDCDEEVNVINMLFGLEDLDNLIYACEEIFPHTDDEEKFWVKMADRFTKARAMLTLSDLEDNNAKEGETDEDMS